jgi:hypothetical protein
VLRSFTATLVGLLAALLLPASLLSVWVDGVVSDTDTYVETVTPLADDDAVKAAAVRELDREALQLVVGARGQLPAGGEKLVRLVVEQVVDSPAFRTAWVRANRAAHDQLVAVLEDRSDVVLDRDGRVSIDLNPVFATVAADLAAQGLGVLDPSAIDASFPVMDAGQLAHARRAYDTIDTLGFWLPLAWLALVALTLLLARRRLAATAKLALASLLGLGLLAVTLAFAREVVTEDLSEPGVARAVWDVVVADLWHQLELCAGVLVLVALVTGVLAGVLGRARTPSGETPDGER